MCARGHECRGLKRRGFSADAISAVREAYKILYRRGLSLDEARIQIRAQCETSEEVASALQILLAFLDASERGIIRP